MRRPWTFRTTCSTPAMCVTTQAEFPWPIAVADAKVGELLDALGAAGLDENTWAVSEPTTDRHPAQGQADAVRR